MIDSIMGSGKTSWSIQHINKSPNENFLYITPFLKEAKRIVEKTERPFTQPINKGKGKLYAINNLLAHQEDIAATHELFRGFNAESIDNIRSGHYTLILDEVLSVIEQLPTKAGDVQILLESNCISIDEEGYVHWNPSKHMYDTVFETERQLAEKHLLVCINNTFLFWKYPPEIFSAFDKIYILTYLFDASILRYYFDMYEIQYEKKSITLGNDGYKLCQYEKANAAKFKDKIHIYEGKLNVNFYHKENTLSVTWYKYKTSDLVSLKNNIYNYFHNIVPTKGSELMWTTFKDYTNALAGKGYAKRMISYNCRSTNELQDVSTMAYCVNIFPHPGIIQMFAEKNIKMDQSLYALAEMLQWIWRSRIRKGEEIWIYIPSKRMRSLLQKWLNNEI